MAQRISMSTFNLATMFMLYVGFSTALHIEIAPENIYKTTKELKITCRTDGVAHWAKTIITLNLAKRGQNPIALYRHKELIRGPDMTNNMKAEGHLDKDTSKSFLTLTITNPSIKDAGTYVCQIFYVDESLQMKEDHSMANLTFIKEDLAATVKNLMNKVTSLENVVHYQGEIISNQTDKLQEQEILLQQQKDFLDKQVLPRTDVLAAMEKNLSLTVQDLIEKESIKSAFFAQYLDGGFLKVDQILKFPYVLENTGNDYNKDTGVYTAPVDGLYAFNLFALSYTKGRRTYIQVRAKETLTLATLLVEHAADTYDQSSVSAVVHLKAGENVKCRVSFVNGNGNRLHTTTFTGFSGYLIKAV